MNLWKGIDLMNPWKGLKDPYGFSDQSLKTAPLLKGNKCQEGEKIPWQWVPSGKM